MGSPYTSKATSGYNAGPPPDDGSQTANNSITWLKIKTKLADVLKTFAEAINTALVTAFDLSVTAQSSAYTTTAADHLKPVTVTGNTTISLGDAATMGSTYQPIIMNVGTGTVTVKLITNTDTLDGITGTNGARVMLPPGASRTFTTNSTGYNSVSEVITDPSIFEFRATLTTGVPVTTADVTAATTIKLTPYKGNRIALFDGTANWVKRHSAEMSLAVPATTSQMYDAFVYDNAGVPTLEALAWTNDTTRATALTLQDGVLVKTGATTRRYAFSFRTTTVSGQTEDSLAKRYLWNYYNRVARPMLNSESANSWNYSVATYRQMAGSSTNNLDFIIGVSEDMVTAIETVSCQNNTTTYRQVFPGIGIDSTSATSAQIVPMFVVDSTHVVSGMAIYRQFPGVGRHTLVPLESGNGTDTQTWYGDNGAPGATQNGITGELFA